MLSCETKIKDEKTKLRSKSSSEAYAEAHTHTHALTNKHKWVTLSGKKELRQEQFTKLFCMFLTRAKPTHTYKRRHKHTDVQVNFDGVLIKKTKKMQLRVELCQK